MMNQTEVRKIAAISDCDHAAMAEEEQVFAEAGFDLKLYQCHTEDDLIEQMADFEVFGNQYAPMTERVFQNLPKLKCVVRYGVGVDHIDLESASRHGVAVCNVPDYGIQEVALQALSLILSLHRKVMKMNESVKSGKWNYEESIPIRRFSELTVGVIGVGRIGSMLTQMLRPLGCRILVCDLACPEKPIPEGTEMSDMDTLLAAADIISIHTPLETSRNMIAKPQFMKMKPRALLVNVSRGGIVNEEDLEEALRTGAIAGAAMDVLKKEPPVGKHPLFEYENFLCTPHMAWYSEEASKDLKRKLAEEMVRAMKGLPLCYQLNSF